ncbi:hypothetical protein J7I98_04340 [Streptomyces sp. ISL-98]|nr:hypothetical protein [Streptomyces sp. ISL-98]MBT2505137.1 hypothetical protein [Streptomyces sp. ISL-98]
MIEEILHSANGVGSTVKDADGKWVDLLDCELLAYTRADGTAGRPFIGFGPDWWSITDVAEVDTVISDLTEVLARMREWREVLASHVGD